MNTLLHHKFIDYKKNSFCKSINNGNKWKCRICGMEMNSNRYHYNDKHKNFKEQLEQTSIEFQGKIFELMDIVVEKPYNQFQTIQFNQQQTNEHNQQQIPTNMNQPIEETEVKEYDDDIEDKLNRISACIEYKVSVLSAINGISFCKADVFHSFLSELIKLLHAEDLGDFQILDHLNNKLKQLNNQAVSKRVRKVGEVLKHQTFKKVMKAEAIGIQLDESTDTAKKSQTIVHARVPTSNDPMNEYEDLFLTIFQNPSYDTDAHSLLRNLKEALKFGDDNLLSKVNTYPVMHLLSNNII